MPKNIPLSQGFEEVPLDSGFEEVSIAPAAQSQQPEEQEPQEPGMAEAFARAMAQGVSFGFSDEATAKLKSMFKGTPYEEEVEKERAAYKAAEQAHPITSTIGEMAGGAIPAIGLTALTGGAAAAPLAARIGLGAAEGLATGALYGAGKAEKDTLKEATSGAGIGALVGGAIPVVGRAFKGAGEAVEKAVASENAPEYLKELASSWKLGRKGQGLVSSGSVEGIKQEVEDVGKKIPQLLKSEESKLGSLREYLLNNSKKTIRVDDLLEKAASNLEKSAITDANPKSPELIQRLKNIAKVYNFEVPLANADDLLNKIQKWGEFAKIPVDVNLLKDELKDRITKQITDPDARMILDKAPENLKKVYESLNLKQRMSSELVPYGAEAADRINELVLPLKDINENLHSIMNTDELLNKIVTPEYADKKMAATTKMAQLIRNLKRSSDVGENVSMRFKEAMKELEKANPNLSKQITQDVSQAAEKHALSRAARGQRSIAESAPSGKGLISGLASDLANVAGVGPMNMMGQTYTKLAKYAGMPEKILKSASERFGTDSVIYKKLQEAASQPDENKRRAALNALMSLEPFRKMLKEEEDAEETR